MRTFVQHGDILDLTVPAGGVQSGVAVKIGAFLVVPQCTVTAAEVTAAGAGVRKFAGKLSGVFELPKINAQAWAEGDLIYFNTTSGNMTNVSAAGVFLVGAASEAAANPSTVGRVRLNAVALPAAQA
jgi:predicted RecA/RadA family phage recombinase